MEGGVEANDKLIAERVSGDKVMAARSSAVGRSGEPSSVRLTWCKSVSSDKAIGGGAGSIDFATDEFAGINDALILDVLIERARSFADAGHVGSTAALVALESARYALLARDAARSQRETPWIEYKLSVPDTINFDGPTVANGYSPSGMYTAHRSEV